MPFRYTCQGCGDTFVRNSSPTSGRANTFCSKKCYGKAMVRGPEDFWYGVQISGPDECWTWKGATTRGGYGHLKYQLGWVYSHRLAWELTQGSVPSGLKVLHRCDNRPCCNPNHLFVGTQAVNVEDMVAKGRQQRGEGHYRSSLTASDVVRIRSLHADRIPMSAIAKAYEVGKKTIEAIVYRKTWKHVT